MNKKIKLIIGVCVWAVISIIAVDKNMYRALLLDSYSEVILNGKGEVMK